MNKLLGHLTTINRHKWNVTKLCFRCGLYKQGLLHDLSKYSWVEFSAGVKYFQGNRSPIDREKEVIGYSKGWLHHKGRNKHHWEYWLDNGKNGVKAVRMPETYVYEMWCDRVTASKIYMKDKYENSSPWFYYYDRKDNVMMHPDTRKLLEKLLWHTKENGSDETVKLIKELRKQK